MCEFCGVVRAVVYCKSDWVRLCLHCVGFVHSANYLSRRHPRSLICNKCSSQPAITRCLDEEMSLCQNCELSANKCSVLGHSYQSLSGYTGTLSIAEISKIWSWVLDGSTLTDNLVQMSTMPIYENGCQYSLDDKLDIAFIKDAPNHALQSGTKFESMVGPSLCAGLFSGPSSACSLASSFLPSFGKNQALVWSEGSNLPKALPKDKNIDFDHPDDLCGDLDVDDVALNFMNCDEIFQSLGSQSTFNIENGGTDFHLMERNASSAGQQDCKTFPSAEIIHPTRGSANGIIINPNTNPGYNQTFNHGYPVVPIHSSMSLSLSNITGESSVADYQDCGLSPLFLSDSPWGLAHRWQGIKLR